MAMTMPMSMTMISAMIKTPYLRLSVETFVAKFALEKNAILTAVTPLLWWARPQIHLKHMIM